MQQGKHHLTGMQSHLSRSEAATGDALVSSAFLCYLERSPWPLPSSCISLQSLGLINVMSLQESN